MNMGRARSHESKDTAWWVTFLATAMAFSSAGAQVIADGQTVTNNTNTVGASGADGAAGLAGTTGATGADGAASFQM